MNADRLRVLVVSPAVPAPFWGFGTRVYQLVRQMAERHDITVLTYAAEPDGPDVGVLRAVCPDVHVVRRENNDRTLRRRGQLLSLASRMPFSCSDLYSDEMQAALDRLLADRAFDIVQLESSQLRCFQLPADQIVILDEHNIEYELLARMQEGERSPLRRLFNRLEHRKFRRLELGAWTDVAGVALTSEREEVIVTVEAPGTLTATVPNSVDVDFFRPSEVDPEPDTIVFTGLLSYRPNLDAALYFLDEVLPLIVRQRPGVVVTFLGYGEESDLERLRRPGVVVPGRVDDIRPYVARSSVVVVPLRIGGGTRLKVVEALAMGKAVVSTTIGCEGIAVRDDIHLLIADDPGTFAEAVIGLLERPETGRRLGAAGRRLVVQDYSWALAGARLEALFVAARACRPGATVPRVLADPLASA